MADKNNLFRTDIVRSKEAVVERKNEIIKGFSVVTKGVTQVGYDGSANFAIRDNLQGAASGWVSEWSDYADLHLGFIMEAKTSGDAGDLLWACVDVWR